MDVEPPDEFWEGDFVDQGDDFDFDYDDEDDSSDSDDAEIDLEDYEGLEAEEELENAKEAALLAYFPNPAWTAGPAGSGGWVYDSQMLPDLAAWGFHHQTADALSTWKSPTGHWEVLLATIDSLVLYRITGQGAEGEPLLLGLAPLQLQPYSIARSADGATIVAGGSMRQLRIFSFEEGREPPLRLDVALAMGPSTESLKFDMVNCVRFLQHRGKEYILVALQDGFIHVLLNPRRDARGNARLAAQNYFVSKFPDDDSPHEWPFVTQREVQFNAGGLTPFRLFPTLPDVGSSVALGRLDCACNSAQPSPCGSFVALLKDEPEVELVSLAAKTLTVLEFDNVGYTSNAGSPSWDPRGSHGDSGAQYCSWSSDSRLLAVSSDVCHAVMVWGIPECTQLMMFRFTLEPALALAFSPSKPSLLAFTERRGRVHLIDVDDALAAPPELRDRSKQCIDSFTPAERYRGQLLPAGLQSDIGEVEGVAFTDDCLLIGARAGLLRLHVLPQWSHTAHRFYPSRFKTAVRALLLCVKRGSPTDQGVAGLQDLPSLAVAKVVECLALGVTEFFSQPADEPRVVLPIRTKCMMYHRNGG